jgi:diguanylate cyclase (GGDEF)-like protein
VVFSPVKPAKKPQKKFFLGELEITRARRYNYRVSVAMLDLDHFKAVNDNYGHEVGDQLLRHFGSTCVELLRDSDLIGRVGGEEFAIIFPHMSAAEALEAVERLRETVAAIKVSGPGDCIIHFTVSTGIAELSVTDKNIDELLGRADRALYEAKHSGRNRSAVAVSDPVSENQKAGDT